VSPYEYSANGSVATAGASLMEDSIRKQPAPTPPEGIKSIIMLTNPHHKNANLDLLANKRRWENEKRGTLISADASRLY
jgi:hypothetical protein